MIKKTTMVSGISLLLLIGVISLAVNLCPKKKSDLPETVSVYDRAAGTVYTPTYEDFLTGCVEGMLIKNVAFEPEALKAIAIAQNTRIKYHLNPKSGFENLGADFSVNEYTPYTHDTPSEEVKSAVKCALNSTFTFDGETFNVPICKISTGRTDECPPYSLSVNLPCDINAPVFESSAAFTPEEVRSALNGGNLPYNCTEWLHDPVYSSGGTLLYIELDDVRISGETLKNVFGLRSSAISADYTEDKFVFTCQGWGENKGMSVYAANFLAKQGKTAEEILRLFYPNAEIVISN